MRIQRSTFEFLLISAILGSIVLCTAYLGYGAGVLAILFWIIFLIIRLKRTATKKQASNSDAESQS
jgi:tellurite resistance protein TehA-like permease